MQRIFSLNASGQGERYFILNCSDTVSVSVASVCLSLHSTVLKKTSWLHCLCCWLVLIKSFFFSIVTLVSTGVLCVKLQFMQKQNGKRKIRLKGRTMEASQQLCISKMYILQSLLTSLILLTVICVNFFYTYCQSCVSVPKKKKEKKYRCVFLCPYQYDILVYQLMQTSLANRNYQWIILPNVL